MRKKSIVLITLLTGILVSLLLFPGTASAVPQYQVRIRPIGPEFVLEVGEAEAVRVDVFVAVVTDDEMFSVHLTTPVEPWQTGAMGSVWPKWNWSQGQVLVSVVFYRTADNRQLWHHDYGPYQFDRTAGQVLVLPAEEWQPPWPPKENCQEKLWNYLELFCSPEGVNSGCVLSDKDVGGPEGHATYAKTECELDELHTCYSVAEGPWTCRTGYWFVPMDPRDMKILSVMPFRPGQRQ